MTKQGLGILLHGIWMTIFIEHYLEKKGWVGGYGGEEGVGGGITQKPVGRIFPSIWVLLPEYMVIALTGPKRLYEKLLNCYEEFEK